MTETPSEFAAETRPRLDGIEPPASPHPVSPHPASPRPASRRPASPRADAAEDAHDADSRDRALDLVRVITERAGYLGLERVTALAAAVERVLSGAEGGAAWASPKVRALVHEATDRIKTLLRAVEDTGAEPAGADTVLLAHLNAAASRGAGAANVDPDTALLARLSAAATLSAGAVAAVPRDGLKGETRVQKFLFSLHTVGLARTLQRTVQKLVPAWLFDANKLAVCETDLSEWRGAAPAPGWNYRWATPADTELLTSRGRSVDEVERFFAHGARGTILEIDGNLIANNWVIPNHWTCFDWIRFELGPTELYGASSFVAPEYRGRQVHQQTRSFAYGCMAGQGYERVFTLIEALNRSSLRAGAGKPRRYLGYLSYVRVLGLVVFHLNGTWRVGFWNARRPFSLTHDLLAPERAAAIPKTASTAFGPISGPISGPAE